MSANYWASSQCNHWLLDRSQLELARGEDLVHATGLECAAIGLMFSQLLSTLCKRLNLRQRVVASANVLFRRFFAKNSYAALDVFLVAATCVYVAAKVEESPIHIKSAVAEAARTFQEVGYRAMPTDNSSLAEMEFYLLEEMEFDMILFHPYRSLLAMYHAYGAASSPTAATTGLGVEVEAFGTLHALKALDQAEAEQGVEARLEEFDEHVLQLAWFVLNDIYRSELPLMHPPYMLALAALWLALSLHPPAYDRIATSLTTMNERRDEHRSTLEALLVDTQKSVADLTSWTTTLPKPRADEALTFFASLNVSLPLLAEVVQQMLEALHLQARAAPLVADGPRIVKLLDRMRSSRRTALLAQRPSHHV